MATYSFGQLEQLWINAGGSPSQAPLMAAIALAESGGRSDAVGHNSDGSTDTGIWQINSVHNVSGMTDPNVNASEAVKIYKSQGLAAWAAYTNGSYKKFMQSGTDPTGTGLPVGSTSTATDASVTGDIGNAIGQGFAAAFTSVFKPLVNMMIWGTETLMGLGLVAIGIFIVVNNTQGGKKLEDTAAIAAVDATEPEASSSVKAAMAQREDREAAKRAAAKKVKPDAGKAN